MSTFQVVDEVMESILRAQARGHWLAYCEVGEEEYREICRKFFGGPWLGKLTCCGLPIRVRRSEQEARDQLKEG